jgi:hypothetical protein
MPFLACHHIDAEADAQIAAPHDAVAAPASTVMAAAAGWPVKSPGVMCMSSTHDPVGARQQIRA